MAKCKYWIGPYKECKLINTHKPCPANVDLTSCDVIPKKPKTKSVSVKGWAFNSLKKGAICAATYKAPGKKCFACTITYRVKGEK